MLKFFPQNFHKVLLFQLSSDQAAVSSSESLWLLTNLQDTEEQPQAPRAASLAGAQLKNKAPTGAEDKSNQMEQSLRQLRQN